MVTAGLWQGVLGDFPRGPVLFATNKSALLAHGAPTARIRLSPSPGIQYSARTPVTAALRASTVPIVYCYLGGQFAFLQQRRGNPVTHTPDVSFLCTDWKAVFGSCRLSVKREAIACLGVAKRMRREPNPSGSTPGRIAVVSYRSHPVAARSVLMVSEDRSVPISPGSFASARVYPSGTHAVYAGWDARV